MAKITIRGKTIDADGVEPYVVAEIGCNHCGNFDLCLKMIRAAAECGADAVKLQKRTNEELFTPAALAEPYHSEHAYGPTYGEHRAALDWFGYKEFVEAAEVCRHARGAECRQVREMRGVDHACLTSDVVHGVGVRSRGGLGSGGSGRDGVHIPGSCA